MRVRFARSGYNVGMGRSEMLIELDGELVDQLDEIARARGTSRSALLREGVRAVIDAEDRLTDDRCLVEAYRRLPEDTAMVESSARMAAATAPEW